MRDETAPWTERSSAFEGPPTAVADAPDGDDAAVEWDPWLAQALYGSLARWMDLPREALEAEIAALEARFGDSLYAETIFILSHLRLPSAEAKRCWRDILDLREEMRRKLGSFVDLRVALATYFVQVNRKLRNPKIIEIQLFERTRAFAYRDDLTGLFNHRFLDESLAQEVLRAERSTLPVSLIMLDVDDFKRVNDVHGHEAGNEVLVAVGRLLGTALRREDLAARYGGEEFAAILPATHKTEAFAIAERARAGIETNVVPLRGTTPLQVTASFGIATCPGDAATPGDLLRCADRALYAAKSAGKNQVQLYGRSRRSFPRFRAVLDGSFRVLGDGSRPLRTVDVSEAGLLFVTDDPLPVGSLLEFQLDLPENRGAIPGVGRVVYAIERERGRFEVAVRLVGIEPRDRQLLSRFVADLRPGEAEAPDRVPA